MKDAYLEEGKPAFWDTNHGTFEGTFAQYDTIIAETRRIYKYFADALDVLRHPSRPRGDESAIMHRITNNDVIQEVAALNAAAAQQRATVASMRDNLYHQRNIGWTSNTLNRAPPAGARLVHVEGTPPPERDPSADTESEGMGKPHHMLRGTYWHEMQNRR
jgi:hypothetical protein